MIDGPTHIAGHLALPRWTRTPASPGSPSSIEHAVGPVARFEPFTGHRSTRNLRLYERAGYRRTRTVREPDRVSLTFLEKVVG